MGNNPDPKREYDEFVKDLFLRREIRKCSSTKCIGNSYLINEEEFLAPDNHLYCSKDCYKDYIDEK